MDAAPEFSIDAFHQGKFYLKQPIGQGHRAGIDAMLLAALVPKAAQGKLADLGAGAGAAGLAVASRSQIEVLLVEASDIMAQYARQSIDLKENQHHCDKCQVLEADVELSGQARVFAGLEDNSFDHVIMNPPFNEAGDRQAPDQLKAKAHVMSDGLFEKWIKTAAAIAKPSGQLSLIARPSSLNKILNACDGRFGSVQITNVQPRFDENAIRILVTGIKGSRARLSLRPPIIMHDQNQMEQNKSYSQMADDLINGRQFWARKI